MVPLRYTQIDNIHASTLETLLIKEFHEHKHSDTAVVSLLVDSAGK